MQIINLFGIVKQSIVDGPGLRYVLFTQGCPHKCPGCHNPGTHDFTGGTKYGTDDIVEDFKKNPLLKGITFSGGEPFCQAAPLLEIGAEIKRLGGDIYIYTGYTLSELLSMSKEDESVRELLKICDVLIDGRFEIDKRDLTLEFRGSSNQNIIYNKEYAELL